MSLLTKIGSRVPAVRTLEQTLANPSKRSYNEVRSEIWKQRVEYWVRRAQDVPVAMRAAKQEARDFLAHSNVTRPTDWTLGDLASAGVVGTQLFGCFCIGEILARKQITGYPQGDHHGHH